jgi:hypothetical protein
MREYPQPSWKANPAGDEMYKALYGDGDYEDEDDDFDPDDFDDCDLEDAEITAV